jgi:hypothetical protein
VVVVVVVMVFPTENLEDLVVEEIVLQVLVVLETLLQYLHPKVIMEEVTEDLMEEVEAVAALVV